MKKQTQQTEPFGDSDVRFLWNLKHIHLLIAMGIIYGFQLFTMRISDDWDMWLHSDDGVPGFIAGACSSFLSVIFHWILVRKTRSCMASLKEKSFQKHIIPYMRNIECSSVQYWVSGVIVSISWIIVWWFWLKEIVPFTTVTWLAGCCVGTFIQMFTAIPLLCFVISLNLMLIRSRDLETSINLLDGKTFYDFKKLFSLLSTATALVFFACASWSYYLFVMGQLKTEQSILTTVLAFVIAGAILLPYAMVLYRLHIFMNNARDETLYAIETKLGKYLKHNIKGNSSEGNLPDDVKCSIEALNILHSNVSKLSTWPFALEDWITISIPFLANLGPHLLKVGRFIDRII